MKRQNVEKSKRQKVKATPIDVDMAIFRVGSIERFRGRWWVIDRVTWRGITLRPAPRGQRTITVEHPVHEEGRS